MKGDELFRAVRMYFAVLAVIGTAAALVFTIHFTRDNMQWVAFLTGILVAAVLAEAVRMSRSEWMVMRRTAQLSQAKDRLEHELILRKGLERKIALDKSRLHLIDDKLQTMVVLIDEHGVCRYHNRAFQEWLNIRPELIDGQHLRQVIGATPYAEIATAVRQSLDGQELRYDRKHQMADGAIYRLSMMHVPQFDAEGKVTGCYILADDITGTEDIGDSANPHVSQGRGGATARMASDIQEMFIDSFSEQITGQSDAGSHIMEAIQKSQFTLYCQLISPMADAGGENEHYEILVRLMEEEEGMMPPGAFFPLAEKHGLMPYLDRWVVQHVLEWASDKEQAKVRREDSVFFLNVAAATMGDPEFPDFLQTTLQEFGLPPSILCFEVPDTELALRGVMVAEFIRRVRAAGCRVALSGFGRDGVSFDRIRGFQVEYLKIDGSIILGMLTNPVSLAKVVSINQVAKKIGVKTVAELVESDELIVKLKEIGVDFAQGFGISRPRSLK
jgi:PAS domain S-box-containing protein